MEQEVNFTPGGLANQRFVTDMKVDHVDLIDSIPEGCSDCSAAWREVSAGRPEKVKGCTGRTEEIIKVKEIIDGQDVVRLYFSGRCHLRAPAAAEE
jgi:hypothetical protein